MDFLSIKGMPCLSQSLLGPTEDRVHSCVTRSHSEILIRGHFFPGVPSPYFVLLPFEELSQSVPQEKRMIVDRRGGNSSA